MYVDVTYYDIMVHVPDVVQVEKRIAEEAERAQHFLDPSTESRITRVWILYVCVVCRCCIWCVLELILCKTTLVCVC